MSHFAKVENGKVTAVIVAEQDFIDSGLVGEPSLWVQTSYNTRRGVHYIADSDTPSSDQSKALRKNYAVIGGFYDSKNDAFYDIQPYPSWVLNTSTWLWESPIPCPGDVRNYYWDEATLSWLVVERPA
jgi:hypothetical protein